MQPHICLITGSTLGGAEYVAEHIESRLQQQGFSTELHHGPALNDVINEKLIQESIIELSKNKTIIVITHRLNTIKNADNILVLKNGVLVESGKHDNLISRGSEYYRLYQGSI